MNGTGKFFGKNRVDHTMPVDSPFAFEQVGHNIDTEVGVSARPMPVVANMLMRLIDHFQM